LATIFIWTSLFILVWKKRAELGGAEVELILRPNGNWLLERGRESTALQLHGQTTVSRWLLILCFTETRGKKSCNYVLWQAEHSPYLFRRLRVYLQLYAGDTT